jgi:hypothetical protein
MTVDELVALLRGFDNRREIIKGISRGLRRQAGPVRTQIRSHTLATMPKRGGLNGWLASIRINVNVKLTGYRGVGLILKGGRNSRGGRADTAAIDLGRVRAPSWGKRGPAAWHVQSVPQGFFTEPAAASGWVAMVDREVDSALDQLR